MRISKRLAPHSNPSSHNRDFQSRFQATQRKSPLFPFILLYVWKRGIKILNFLLKFDSHLEPSRAIILSSLVQKTKLVRPSITPGNKRSGNGRPTLALLRLV